MRCYFEKHEKKRRRHKKVPGTYKSPAPSFFCLKVLLVAFGGCLAAQDEEQAAADEQQAEGSHRRGFRYGG